MHSFIVNLAFSLLRTDAIVEWLDVRHVALEKLGALAGGRPVRYLDIWTRTSD